MKVNMWMKAAKSGNNGGDCVEWRLREDGTVEVADTKDGGHGPVLRFTPTEWAAFKEGLLTGETVPSRP